jgi:hypothetical protein
VIASAGYQLERGLIEVALKIEAKLAGQRVHGVACARRVRGPCIRPQESVSERAFGLCFAVELF